MGDRLRAGNMSLYNQPSGSSGHFSVKLVYQQVNSDTGIYEYWSPCSRKVGD